MSVTIAGAYSSSLKAFLSKGHIPATKKPFVMFFGVAEFTTALVVTKGTS